MSPQTRSKTKSSSRSKKETTFFDILKKDHDKVRDIFGQIEETEDTERRQELFSTLQSELQTHMELEEKFFYPILEENEETRDKALESYEEHHVAETVLDEFGGLNVDDDHWNAKIKVLQEIVNHHIEEEENNTFKMAKKFMEQDQIMEITDQIQEMKGEGEVERKAA